MNCKGCNIEFQPKYNNQKYHNHLCFLVHHNKTTMRLKHLGKNESEESNKKRSNKLIGKKRPNSVVLKISKKLKGVPKTLEHRKNLSLGHIKSYKEHPEFIQKMCSSDKTKPNSFEHILIEIINKNGLPLKWVGNGKFWITHKGKNHNPDFIAEKPINLVIEIFANFFKERNFGSIKNYIKYRKEAFNAKGFKIIFFNEKSILNEQKVLNKLQRHFNKLCDKNVKI